MDPLDAISEGTLLLAVEPEASEEVVAKLKRRGILAVDIGAFTKRGGPCRDQDQNFNPAERDPFWVAFSRALSGEIS